MYKSCTSYGIEISNDSQDKRLTHLVENVTMSNMYKASIIATFFNENDNENFRKFILDNLTKNNSKELEKLGSNITIKDLDNKTLSRINLNVLNKLIRDYYKLNVRDIDNYNAKENNDSLDGFTSNEAKYRAKVFTASKIIELYYANNGKISNIKEKISNNISNIFLTRYALPLAKEYAEGNIENGNKNLQKIAKEFIDINDDINELNNIRLKLNKIKLKISELKNDDTKKEEISKLTKEYNKLAEDYKTINKEKINTKYSDLINEKGIVTLEQLVKRRIAFCNEFNKKLPNTYTPYKNFYNLYVQVSTDKSSKWYEDVFKLKRLLSVNNLFNELTEEQKVFEQIIDDEDTFNNYDNDEDIDETAKSWIDKTLSSYEANIANDVKLYLSSFYEMNSPTKPNSGEYNYKIDSELGVRIPISNEFLIQQLSSKIDFTTPKDFLEKVKYLSQNVPELYTLVKLYDDCSKNKNLLNRIFHELSQNKTTKIQIAIGKDNNRVRISNEEMIEHSKLLYDSINSIISSYRELYDYQDFFKLTTGNIESKFNSPVQREITIKHIINVANKYIPSIPKKFFENYLNRPNLTLQEFTKMINAFVELGNDIKDLKNSREYIEKEYANALIKYKENKRESNINDSFASFFGFEDKKDKQKEIPKPKRDYSKLNYKKLYSGGLVTICKELSKYNIIDVNLNSRNGDNEMATDLLPNSMLSNLNKQLKNKQGRDKLRDFIWNTKGIKEQYKYSNFYFGTPNHKGLFIKNLFGNIPTINENADKLLHIELFNGIRDNANNKGEMYNKMSKGDYFLTKLYTFFNPVDHHDNSLKNDKNIEDKAGYFLRVPSDAPKNFIVQMTKYSYEKLFKNNDIDKNSDIFIAIRNVLYGEINNALNQLLIISDENGNINEIADKKYFENYHYKKGKMFSENNGRLELTGNVFNFIKLFEINGFNVNNLIKDAISLYGGPNSLVNENNGKLIVNRELVTTKINDGIESYGDILNNITENWINKFLNYIDTSSLEYSSIINDEFSSSQIRECMLNYFIAYNTFDELFEGDGKFYKDAQTFLKRAKEVQAGGKSYSSNFDFILNGEAIEEYNVFDDEFINNNNDIFDENKKYHLNKDFKVKTGFKAIIINNTVRPSDNAENIKNELYNIFIKQGYDKDVALKKAELEASKFSDNTKTNDAQSYITFEEFIRRRVLDGTIDKYKNLISQIYKLEEKENGEYDYNDIDLTNDDARVEVQKNFYYDLGYDEETNICYPRQIKNAEFVLIPQLLPKDSGLRKLYDLMIENGIDQVNTAETSKAAKKNILTIFDNDGNFNENVKEDLKDGRAINTFYYKYLYKQQEVPKHLVDKQNKIAVQLLKKILDNIKIDSQVYKYAENIQECYSENIKESMFSFIDKMGWEFTNDDDGQLILKNKNNNDENLDFSKFLESGKYEAQRLGLDSNILDYFTVLSNGQTKMPNCMSNVSIKLESIAQSMFNSNITRQKLSGWHAAQITNVGYSKKLKYHPQIKDENGNVIQEAYAEVMIPRWSNIIPKDYPIEKLAEESLDIQLGYRIPTEGKQSISILKVVGFLPDVYDSTIMVPDEWVTQTGSDFDVDSVYGICHKLYKTKDKDGNIVIKKIKFDNDESENGIDRRFINKLKIFLKDNNYNDDLELLNNTNTNKINIAKIIAKEKNFISYGNFKKLSLIQQNTKEQREALMIDSIIEIMKDESSREENYLCSNFKDISDANNKLKSIYNKANGINDAIRSQYNPFDQLDFMENATSGIAIKGISVMWDTMTSVCNVGNAELEQGVIVKLPINEYDIDNIKKSYDILKYDDNYIYVRLNKFGWSKNNLNLSQQLITPYSSETTAHILDVIKEGALINENTYTFPVFKMLVSLGVDYETALAFLMSPGVSKITKSFNDTNSLYTTTYGDIINITLKNIAIDLRLKYKRGKKEYNIDEYTSINIVMEKLYEFGEENGDGKSIKDIIEKIETFDTKDEHGKTNKEFILDKEKLFNRLQNPIKSDDINDLAYDIYIIQQFKELLKYSNSLNAIMNVSNPDKFGAKQTIRETKNIINKINKFSNPKSKNSIGNTLTINGVPFTKSLYGYNSFYNYLKSFLINSTLLSTKINSNLFILESEEFDNLYDLVCGLIGKELTNEEYKIYKNYLMNMFYNQIDVLNIPLTIDNKGFIIRDDDRITQYDNENNPFNIQDTEKFRILGYNLLDNDDFELKDFNNPAKEEIIKFNNYSPVQKVIWIKKHFEDNAGIFNKLNTQLFNQYEYNSKGYSKGIITYNDNGNDTDALIHELNTAFNSKHPFIKLAVIDLVKYSFISEGFKFKYGNISKIIPNDVLLNFNVDGAQENIIEKLLNIITPNNVNIDRFVRANSTLIPNIKLKNGSEILNTFNIAHQRDYFYIIDTNNDNSNKEFIKYITKDLDEIPSYIRITRKINNENITTLFKIAIDEEVEGIYYMYPLNLLEQNETSEFSSNNEFNKYYPQTYYQEFISLLNNYKLSYKEITNDAKYNDIKEKVIEEIKELQQNNKITKNDFNQFNSIFKDENYFVKLANDETNKSKANIIKNFFNKIDIALKTKSNLINETNYSITGLFKYSDDVSFVQNIEINGEKRKIFIKKHKFSKAAYKYSIGKLNNVAKVPNNELKYINSNPSDKLLNNCYEVYDFIDENAKKEAKEVLDNSVEKRQDINNNKDDFRDLYAATTTIASTNSTPYLRSELSKIELNIVNNILYNKKEEVIDERDIFNKAINKLNVDKTSLKSIYENQKEIFKYINEYYESYIAKLNNDIQNFIASNGTTYNISDPDLYEYLINAPEEDYNRLIKIILQASTLKNNMKEFFDMDIDTGDNVLNSYINNIKNNINKISNNSAIKQSLKNIFDIYFAKKYSNNPNVKDGFVKLSEIFGDVKSFDRWFSDVSELSNKEVQVIANLVHSKLDTAETFLAPEALNKFNKEYDRIMNMPGEFDINHIISDDWKFIKDFTDNFIKDRKELYDKLEELKNSYGVYSKEYQKKKFEIEKWKLRNTEQQLKDEYYEQKIKEKEKLFANEDALNLYIEYIRLSNLLNDQSLILQDTDEEIKRQQDIQSKKRALISKYNNIDGNLKAQNELKAISILMNYFKEINKINDTYFHNTISEEFNKKVKKYQDFIKKYDIDHSNETIDEKMKNDNYKEAKNWLALNGHYDFNKDAKGLIADAFNKLKSKEEKDKENIFNKLLKEKNRLDRFGIIDGRLFTDKEIEELRNYTAESYKNSENQEIDASIIKDLDNRENIVYKKEYYKLFENDTDESIKKAKKELITKINDILLKGFDENGHLNSKKLFDECSIDELKELAKYLKEFRSYKSNLSKKQIEYINKYTTTKHSAQFQKEYGFYRTELKNDKVKADLWRKIFLDYTFDKNGNYTLNTHNDIVHGNSLIYSETIPKKEYEDKFIDKEKTEAKRFIDNNIEYEKTQYYYIARDEAINNGTYNEWFNKNHVYNPYTQKYIPLSIWTNMVPSSTGELIDGYKFLPKREFIRSYPKDIYLNPNYNKYESNYKNTGDYNSNINLSDKEKIMKNFLKDTISRVHLEGSAKDFAKQGYLPRRRGYTVDTKFVLNQAAGVFGLNVHSRNGDTWYNDFDYANDREIEFSMMQLLRDKSYKDTKPIPPKTIDVSEEAYQKRIDPILKENEEIIKHNREIDKKLLDRDLKAVFGDFVQQSVIYEEKQKLKNTLYLLLQSLNEIDAYSINNFNKVSRGRFNIKEETSSSKINQDNTIAVTKNWARRVLFNQFQEKHPLRYWADIAQNMTSAKYMILNLTGGIANITTGLTNIMGERFAKDYFGSKEFLKAEAKYSKNIIHFLADMFSETSSNFYVALAKKFDVVDIDAMLERQGNKGLADKILASRDLLYGFQSGGEHYMQTSVLFAMMNAVKVIPAHRNKGKAILCTFGDYISEIHKDCLMEVISEDEILKLAYENFRIEIEADINIKKKIDEFSIDVYTEFAKKYLTKEQQKAFIKLKNERIKNAKNEFNTFEDVESQIDKDYFNKTNEIRIRPNSEVDINMLGEFRHKVIEVNKKIHGVYDKIGAAYIERKWWGSLVMQYHKHLYPGIMKRWRGLINKGYFNESRGTPEYGSYVTLGKFLSMEFKNVSFKDETNDKIDCIKGIQNIFKSIINTFVDFNLNYHLMPEWEQNNLKRAFGDLCGIGAALLSIILLYSIFDDDEIKDSDFLSTILYLSDRLHSESFMYNPIGLYTEAKTLYSSPIAALNGPSDLMQSMTIIYKWLFDENYDINYTTGQYKGENKLKVKLVRNIPGYRVYDRLQHMSRNNSYYRIGDNNWNIKLGKNIAEFITD